MSTHAAAGCMEGKSNRIKDGLNDDLGFEFMSRVTLQCYDGLNGDIHSESLVSKVRLLLNVTAVPSVLQQVKARMLRVITLRSETRFLTSPLTPRRGSVSFNR